MQRAKADGEQVSKASLKHEGTTRDGEQYMLANHDKRRAGARVWEILAFLLVASLSLLAVYLMLGWISIPPAARSVFEQVRAMILGVTLLVVLAGFLAILIEILSARAS